MVLTSTRTAAKNVTYSHGSCSKNNFSLQPCTEKRKVFVSITKYPCQYVNLWKKGGEKFFFLHIHWYEKSVFFLQSRVTANNRICLILQPCSIKNYTLCFARRVHGRKKNNDVLNLGTGSKMSFISHTLSLWKQMCTYCKSKTITFMLLKHFKKVPIIFWHFTKLLYCVCNHIYLKIL